MNNFRCSVELHDYEPDVQHDLRLPIGESSGTLHLLLVISGLSCKEENDVLSGNLIKQAKVDFVSKDSNGDLFVSFCNLDLNHTK